MPNRIPGEAAYNQAVAALDMTEADQRVEVGQDVLTELLRSYAALKAERDEAVARLHEQRGATTRMEAERDEARAEVERLREALRAILEHAPREVVKDDFAFDRMVRGYRDAARAALGEGKP